MKVFGREKESRALTDFLFSSPNAGSRTVLLSGEAGMGKSLLARQVREQVQKRGGLFLEVTCNPVNSSEEDFSQALSAAVDTVTDNLNIPKWREALAPFADVVSSRLGSLAETLQLESTSPVDRTAAQQTLRFRQTASRVFGLLQELAAPVILFLDDFQWADPESFELQRFLAADGKLSGLRLLLVARPEECAADQWRAILNSCELHLPLDGLSVRVVCKMVEERLALPQGQAGPRAKDLAALSQGNPLYVSAALSLMSTGDEDLAGLTREELLARTLKLLSPESLTLLGQAACIGKSFHPRLLSLLSSVPIAELELRLERYLDRGILLRQGSDFEFRHDKLRDAVKELTSPEAWLETHLALGRLLTQHTETFAKGVEHLGQSWTLMTAEERREFARQALQAARAARRAGAANRAFLLCKEGARAIGAWSEEEQDSDGAEAWRVDQDLACELCLEAAEATEGSTEEQLWQKPVSLLLDNGRSLEVLVRASLAHARALSRQGRHQEVLDVCEAALKRFPNYRELPQKNLQSGLLVFRLVRKLRRMAKGRFKELPRVADTLVTLKQEVMAVQTHSSIHADFDSVPFFAIRACEALLLDGVSSEGAHALVSFCVAVGWRLNQRELARQAFDYCSSLLEEQKSAGALQALLVREVAIECRSLSTPEVARGLEDFHRKCLAAGNIEFAVASLSMGCFHRFLSGAPVPDLERRLEYQLSFIRQFKAVTADNIVDMLNWTLCLVKRPEVELEPPPRPHGVHDLLGQTLELQTFLISKKYGRAVKVASEKPADELPIQGHLHLCFWLLVSVACYWGLRLGEMPKSRALRLFSRSRKAVKSWCLDRSDRAWMLKLVDGSKALGLERSTGEEYLVSALREAKNHGVLHLAAMIAEILADGGPACDASRYKEIAGALTAAWRGDSKDAPTDSNDRLLSRAIEDLATCTSTEALSEKLIELTSVNAKAERVSLISCLSRPYTILAARPLTLDSSDPSQRLPLSILESAQTRSEALIFNDQDLAGFTDTPSLQGRDRPDTVMVVPISYKSQVEEVLYLEASGEARFSEEVASLLQLIGLQWKLLSIQLERAQQLERQRDLLDRVRQTRHQEALRAVALEARRTALATFLGVASHDLKSPLSAIGMWASQLPEGPEKENIQAACSRATGLIHDYLDGMALELGNKIRLEKQKFDLADLVEQEIDHQLDSLDPSVRGETRLQWDLDSVELQADPLRLRQVIANLLGNALKHCPQGTPITVKTGVDSKEALFEVRDEGPGLEPQRQKKLFEAFDTSASGNGSGLGLWIVKKVVGAHGGTVGYERLESGSSFWVRLPL